MAGAEEGVCERAGDRDVEVAEEEDLEGEAEVWPPSKGALVLLLSLWVRSFSVWDLRGSL
jgi:hypothetical protein